MVVSVGDMFVAGDGFSIFPGAWVVMGMNPHNGRELLMMRPDGVLQWTGSYAWMCWEHFLAEDANARES